MDKTSCKRRDVNRRNCGAVRCVLAPAGLFVLILLLVLPVRAMAIEGLPGSTWDQAFHDFDSLVGSGGQGWINQGIDWTTLPGGITFNTFAEFRYRLRTENNDSYNVYGPALGLEFKKYIFHLGVDYYWERFPGLDETDDHWQIYLTLYYDWNLKTRLLNTSLYQGLPGSTWDAFTQDFTSLVGSGAQGWINQGIDWTTLPAGIIFNTFAEFRYRLRTENTDFYNSYGPAIGTEFRKSIFRLGFDYYWERFPGLNEWDNKWEIYLTMYYDWDLKSLKK
jgi:hypothetical protein